MKSYANFKPSPLDVLIYNPHTGEVKEEKLKPNANGSYHTHANEIIGSRTITAVMLPNYKHTIYLDDEGLLNPEHVYSFVYFNPNRKIEIAYAGTVIFVNHDENGNTISLTTTEKREIRDLIKRYKVIAQHPETEKTYFPIALNL